jgi:hypothetical protein
MANTPFERLPAYAQRTLLEDAAYPREELVAMSAREVIDTWLTWIGIQGFTSMIEEVVISAHGREGAAK